MLGNLPRVASWVFTARPSRKYPVVGRQISDRRALQHLKTVLSKLGLEGHLHTFRHSFISHALTSGVPEAIVRDWVGHVDREIIRVYTHIADPISRSAMQGLFPGADKGPNDLSNV
jgi:integrase/recombinase XerD